MVNDTEVREALIAGAVPLETLVRELDIAPDFYRNLSPTLQASIRDGAAALRRVATTPAQLERVNHLNVQGTINLELLQIAEACLREYVRRGNRGLSEAATRVARETTRLQELTDFAADLEKHFEERDAEAAAFERSFLP